jgi:hypothetical protein
MHATYTISTMTALVAHCTTDCTNIRYDAERIHMHMSSICICLLTFIFEYVSEAPMHRPSAHYCVIFTHTVQ